MASKLKTLENFNKFFFETKKSANKMHIPDMLEKIEPLLTKSWNYKKQILSINKGRNCLVHRGGLVTWKDINDERGKALNLEYVKAKIFYEKEDKEIEVKKGEAVYGGAQGTEIKLKNENNIISFVL